MSGIPRVGISFCPQNVTINCPENCCCCCCRKQDQDGKGIYAAVPQNNNPPPQQQMSAQGSVTVISCGDHEEGSNK